jgi:hypothetical protein
MCDISCKCYEDSGLVGCCCATQETPIILCNQQFITAVTTCLHRKQPHLKNPFRNSSPTFQDKFCGAFCVTYELRLGKQWSMKHTTQSNKTDCTVNIVVAIHRMIAPSIIIGYNRRSLFLGVGTPEYPGDPSCDGRVASTYCISGVLTVALPGSENM